MKMNEKNEMQLSGELFSERTIIGQYIRHIQKLSKDCEAVYEKKYKAIVEEKKKEGKEVFLTIIIRTQGKRVEGLREDFLCLQAQTNQDFEVILVGHKVQEENLKNIEMVLSELNQEMRAKTRFISVDEGTRSTPINYGFAYANGKYVSIYDDDDLLFANYVDEFYKASKYEDGKLLHAYTFAQNWRVNTESKDGTGYCATSAPQAKYCEKFDVLKQYYQNKCPLMSIAFPGYLFSDYGIIFDETLDVTEDWDYIMRVAPMCGVCDIDEPTSIYRLWGNLENSAALHNQETWDNTYQAVRNKANRYPLLLPSGFLTRDEEKDNNSQVNCVSGFPRMSGVLFCDLGEGFSDSHFVTYENKTGIPEFELKFKVPDECKNAVRYRIDPCEYGGIILRNCEIRVSYQDGTEDVIHISDCEHNGLVSGRDIYFMHYDPMLIWDNVSAVDEIVIKGYVSMEVPESLIQKEIERASAVYANSYAEQVVAQEVAKFQEQYSKKNIVKTLLRRLRNKIFRK